MARKQRSTRSDGKTSTRVAAPPPPLAPIHRKNSEGLLAQLFDFFSSIKLAIPLIAILSLALAIGTVWESRYGAKAAQLDIYKRFGYIVWVPSSDASVKLPLPLPGFGILLLLLGMNIFCAALSRYPWKRHQTGFVITHAGLLVLLAGSLVSYRGGLEGQMHIKEGAEENSLLLLDEEVISLKWYNPHNPQPNQPVRAKELPFVSGPHAWAEGRRLPINTQEPDVKLAVTGYKPSTKVETEFVDSASGDPLIRLRVHGSMPTPAGSGQSGQSMDEPFQLFLNENGRFTDSSFGPAGTTFWRVTEPTEVQDFLNPMVTDFFSPPTDLPESGVLHAHYSGRIEKIPVEGNVGKRVPLPGSSMEVEITDYRKALHPHQHAPGEVHDEEKEGPEPADPVLRLQLHSGGQTLDQFVMARAPYWPTDRDQLLSLLSRGRAARLWPSRSPVQFWFHHPAVRPSSTGKLEIVLDPKGDLYYRVWARAGLAGKGKIEPQTDYPAWMGLKFRLDEFRPSVELERKVVPIPRTQPGMSDPIPGIRVAMKLGSDSAAADREFWLQKTEGRRFMTPDGQVLEVSFDIRKLPLDFSLTLKDFEVGFDPGTTKAATYTSVVDLKDNQRDVDTERVITMNQPLVHGPAYHFARSVENATGSVYDHWLLGIPIRGFVRSVRGFTDLTFYQSSYYKNPDGSMSSVFSVALDPGYPMKMLGCTMIVGGIVTMFYMRAYFFKPRGKRVVKRTVPGRVSDPSPGSAKAPVSSEPVAMSEK